jgi:hypothetical protein
MKDSGRRWLIAAVGLFLFLLVGWVLLALQLNSALAGPLPFGPGLMSKLSADYRADEGGRSVALISLSILNDAMVALGLTEDEAAAAHESMELAMSQPVPTATAMDFDGAAPFTATPTITKTPRPTNAPSATPTNTRRAPTRTPEPTETDKPTKTPGAPTATGAAPTATGAIPSATPGGGDTQDPEVESFSVNPAPGTLDPGVCTIEATVTIVDEGPSDGIDTEDVGMKYENPDGPPPYIYSYNMVLVDGGPDGFGGWDATYTGSITFTDIDFSSVPSVLKLAMPMNTYEDIDVWFIFRDLAGNENYMSIGTYRLENDCD